MDMLTAIMNGRVWRISGRAAQQFILDVRAQPKTYEEMRTIRRAWETKDKKVYAEWYDEKVWCLVARNDPEDLLQYIKYKFL